MPKVNLERVEVLCERIKKAYTEIYHELHPCNTLLVGRELVPMLSEVAEIGLETLRGFTETEFLTVGRPERGWGEGMAEHLAMPWA